MKGIIFTESNFLLTIQGVKKETRRIIKPSPTFYSEPDDEIFYDLGYYLDSLGVRVKPRYKVGEIVYLKEPYAYAPIIEEQKDIYPHDDFIYRYGHKYMSIKWKNKLFMPEIAARYFIKITNVRAERLQDISDEDCIREGITSYLLDPSKAYTHIKEYGIKDYMGGFNTPQEAYAALIDSINGKDTWESNPWVWVYDYELKLNNK